MRESHLSLETHHRSVLNSSSCIGFSVKNCTQVRNHLTNHSNSSNNGENCSSCRNSCSNSINWKNNWKDTHIKVDKRNWESCSLHTISYQVSSNYYWEDSDCGKAYRQYCDSWKDHRKSHLKDNNSSTSLPSGKDQRKASLSTQACGNWESCSTDYQG